MFNMALTTNLAFLLAVTAFAVVTILNCASAYNRAIIRENQKTRYEAETLRIRYNLELLHEHVMEVQSQRLLELMEWIPVYGSNVPDRVSLDSAMESRTPVKTWIMSWVSRVAPNLHIWTTSDDVYAASTDYATEVKRAYSYLDKIHNFNKMVIQLPFGAKAFIDICEFGFCNQEDRFLFSHDYRNQNDDNAKGKNFLEQFLQHYDNFGYIISFILCACIGYAGAYFLDDDDPELDHLIKCLAEKVGRKRDLQPEDHKG